MDKSTFYISTFYLFKVLPDLDFVKNQLESLGQDLKIKGLFIIAQEGVNSTFSCPDAKAAEAFKTQLRSIFSGSQLTFKDSQSEFQPFKLFKVKKREEIVTAGNKELFPDGDTSYHLNPTEWNQVLKNEKDVLLIDTRNWYETHIGKFKGAVDPNIEVFTDFTNYIKENDIAKDKKILMYCTGGIRCEKGKLQLNEMGYDNVYQLDGGILKYIEEYPNDMFEGECFVFDHRVAVDQELKASKKFKLCPHSGQPATIDIVCQRCDSVSMIAKEVKDDPIKSITCSKNCAYHWGRRPGQKGPKQV